MVRVHTCWCISTPASTFTHMLVHLHTGWYIYTPAGTFTHLLVHLHTCWYIYTPSGTFTHLLVHLYTCWYIYTPSGTFTHLLVHICTSGLTCNSASLCRLSGLLTHKVTYRFIGYGHDSQFELSSHSLVYNLT